MVTNGLIILYLCSRNRRTKIHSPHYENIEPFLFRKTLYILEAISFILFYFSQPSSGDRRVDPKFWLGWVLVSLTNTRSRRRRGSLGDSLLWVLTACKNFPTALGNVDLESWGIRLEMLCGRHWEVVRAGRVSVQNMSKGGTHWSTDM